MKCVVLMHQFTWDWFLNLSNTEVHVDGFFLHQAVTINRGHRVWVLLSVGTCILSFDFVKMLQNHGH